MSRIAHPRRASRVIAAALAGVVLVLAGCSGAPSGTGSPSATGSTAPPAEAATLQRALDDARTAIGFPGAIARVITPDGTWTGSTGTARTGGSAAPTPSDHTRIGSLTKTMTATILLQLVGEKKVSLDDPISRYVPGLPNGDATLRQLADMTSGIPSYTLDPQITQTYLDDPSKPWTPAELLDGVRTLPASFPTGTGWQYSNSNYIALGAVIEKVTGESLADVFQHRIFDPLGMASSSYPSDAVLPEPYLSGTTLQGATGSTPRDATHFTPTFAGSAGQVISTLDDMTRWAHALFTGDGVLTPAMEKVRRDSILTAPAPNNATSGYGIGIGRRDGWWGHDGDIPGYTTSVFHDDARDVTVIVLVGSDIEGPGATVAPAPDVFARLVAALGP
ncbi:MAG: beta-lactamase family protein [Actinobacteria bacterium]|nr:beta-lactamase family protein [Actinomycetota bacterium]